MSEKKQEINMIHNIRIRNYKSLRDVEISLRKFNVVIGPNASGKSNFLDCINLLSRCMKAPITHLMGERGNYEHIVFGGQRENNVSISTSFSLDGEKSEYTLSFSGRGFGVEYLEGVFSRNEEGYTEIYPKSGPLLQTQTRTIDSVMYVHTDRYAVLSKYRKYLASWRLYKFETSAMRGPVQIVKDFDLSTNGGNIAGVLHSLHSERLKIFYQIENVLKQGIPEIEELVSVLTVDGRTYVAVREKGFQDYLFDYYQLSDGTLKLLAYIVAISSVEPKLVCFEEPENFVHPRLLQLLVEILKKSDKQVILSTHSPYLLDYVQPEDVIIFEKKEGATQVKRIENMELIKKHLKEIGLGALWYGGEVGGVP